MATARKRENPVYNNISSVRERPVLKMVKCHDKTRSKKEEGETLGNATQKKNLRCEKFI